MTPEIIPFVREADAEATPVHAYDAAFERITPQLLAAHGLTNHMRQLQPRNHGIGRWLALAVVAGTVAALAFVNFLAR